MCLNSHYRKQLLFSYDILDNMAQSYHKLKNKIASLNKEGRVSEFFYDLFDDKFKGYLADDLNTANALSLIYDLLKSEVDDKTKYELIKAWDSVLSLNLLNEKELDEDLKKFIETKIEERQVAKKNKDFKTADKIRDELEQRGIILKDTRDGVTYELI